MKTAQNDCKLCITTLILYSNVYILYRPVLNTM